MKISRIIITICLYPLVGFVLHAQIIGFKGEPTEICAGQQVVFTDTSSGFSGSETYDWDFGTDASPATANTKGPHTVTYTAAGSKNVKLTIVDGSTYVENKTNYITVYSNPAASITPDPAETCEGVGLSLDGNPSGGSGTYTTHLWTGAGATYLNNVNSQTPVFTCGTDGNYSLTYTVTDDNGCEGSDNITVTVNSNPSASITPDPAETCEGVGLSLDGNPSGGSGTYTTHLWTGAGATYLDNENSQTPTFTCGTGGNYSLTYTVTDDNGCQGNDNITVTVANPSPNIIPDPAETCEGVGLSLDGNPSGGSGTYTTHLWTGAGAAYLDNVNSQTPTFTCGTTGNYSLTYTVTDDNSCEGSDNITVTVNSNPTASIIPDPAKTCEGVGLSLNGNPSGGSGTYTTHLWTGAGATYLNNVNSQTPVFTCGTDGNYSLTYTVTDDNGCEGSDNITVTVNSNPSASITPDPAGTCEGVGLSLDGNPSGGSGTYTTHLWTGAGATYLNNVNSQTPVFTCGTDGNYSLTYTVTDDNGCEGSDNITVTVYPNPTANITPDPAEVCSGSDLFLNGNPAGGSGSYTTHTWTGDTGPLSSTIIVNPTFNASVAVTTTYNLTYAVIDNRGCTGSDNITVTNFAYPLDNLTVSDPVICLNETANIIVSNSETTVSYQLRLDSDNSTVGAPKIGTGGDLTFDVIPSSTTVYNVYATTLSSTCSVELSDKSTVTVNPLPNQYEVIGGGEYCAGGNGKPVYLADSETGFSYQLQRDGLDTGSPVSGTGSSIGFGDQTAAGIYTVVSTNQTTFCQNDMSGSVDVIINPLPIAYNVTGGGAYCAGGPGVTVGLSDSETGVDYQLKVDGADTGSPVAGDGSAISFGNQTTEGTFTVFATNTSTGCTNNMTGSVDVIIKPLPEAVINGGGAICQGETIDVIVSLTGTPDFIFVYAIDAANQPPVNTSNDSYTINTGTAGTYTLVSVDDAICSGGIVSGSAVVTVNPLPIPQNVLGGGSYCSGGSGVEVSLSGSENNVDYQLLLDGVSTGSPVPGDGNPVSFGNQTAEGDYTVTATNSLTGCFNTMTGLVNITIDPLPVAYSVTGGGPYCAGGTGVEVGLSGSEVGIDYQLQKDGSDIGTAVSGTGSAISFGNQTEAGNYTVVATNTTTGCLNSMNGSVDVVINPLPTPVISGDQQVCENDQGLSYSTPYFNGHNYNWVVTGGSIVFGQNTHSIIVDWGSAGTGTVKVTEIIDVTGCDSTTSDYTVTIYALPSAPAITGDLSYCAGSTTILTSSAGVSYLWSTGETNQSINVGEGDYFVKITDANGCQSPVSSTVTVTEIPLPTATISGDAAICDDGSEATITVNLTGTAPWEITYQIDGANDSTITNINSSPYKFNTLIPGQYSISKVSDTFCTGNSFGTVTLTVNPLPGVEITGLYTYYNINKDTVNLNATPSGGNFYGSPGIDDYEKVFKPSVAGLGDHYIIYTYTDNNLCTNYDTVIVTVIDAEGDITSLSGNDDFVYCYDGVIDTLQGSSVGGEPGGKFSGNGIDSIDLDMATFNPTLAGPGTHRIVYTYIKDSVALDIVEFFTVDSIGEIDFVGLASEYCINNDMVELTPISPDDLGGTGTMEFSGSLGISGNTFNPNNAAIGSNSVDLTYTRDFSGCIRVLNRTVEVYDIPHLDFAVSDGCVNDRDSTIFFNLTNSIDPVITWKWDFDDPASLEENTSNQETPKHQYPGFGRRSIEMIGITDKNCRDTLVRDVDFEEKPLAGFEWENECYSENKSIPFKDNTFSNSTITNYLWKFYDTNGIDTLATYNTEDTVFVFPTQSDYPVELIVNTANGCTDTIKRTIQLRPTIRLADGVYYEDFESGPQGWIAEADDISLNSWELGLPSNNIINSAASGNNSWVTELDGNHFDSENSWITSPCFDFREMERPMIKMNIFINSEGDRDGAVLQFSINNGIDWSRVGEFGDGKGLDWFNSVGILGNPGGQQQGWSGTGNNNWQEVRHDLDQLIGSNGVQFRVAFGAGAEGNMEGFAFDNVWIGERTRKVILEHFTNTTESVSEKADSTVNAIANKDTLDIIDIQYHTNFPGSDMLNEYYPAGPGARAIYYGVSDVPYSIMDGWEYFEGFDDQDNYLWKESDMLKRSLYDPQVKINLSAQLDGNTLNVNVTVDTLKPVPSNHEITLHIVILENQVESGDKTYENVIRKMLPDPGGTQITNDLLQGSISISESWTFNSSEINRTSLIVVAFVQDEETAEIFQAAALNYAGIITGITIPGSEIRQLTFNIYPNPASGSAVVEFTQILLQKMTLEVYNQLGRLIEIKEIESGINRFTLNTNHYNRGVYYLKISDKDKVTGIKRLVIIK